MANVLDDDDETLDLADESEYIGEGDDERPRYTICPVCTFDLHSDGYPIEHQDPATGEVCTYRD